MTSTEYTLQTVPVHIGDRIGAYLYDLECTLVLDCDGDLYRVVIPTTSGDIEIEGSGSRYGKLTGTQADIWNAAEALMEFKGDDIRERAGFFTGRETPEWSGPEYRQFA